MRKAKALLEALTASYPPGDGQRHSIHINPDGDLEITLFLGEHYQPIVITGDDLDTPNRQALIEIDEVLPTWCKESNLSTRKPPALHNGTRKKDGKEGFNE